MRTGEVFALTWNDIDLKNRLIIINKTVYSKLKDEKGRWFLGTAKTEGSCREVYICDTLYKALCNYKKQQQLYKKKYGNKSKYKNRNNIEMVFTRKNGSYAGTDIIKYPFKIIRHELQIKNCRFYDLRGSYATKCLRNGVEIKDVADILGHKRIETTENYYISSTAENKNDVTTVFDKVMTSELINNIIKYDIAY